MARCPPPRVGGPAPPDDHDIQLFRLVERSTGLENDTRGMLGNERQPADRFPLPIGQDRRIQPAAPANAGQQRGHFWAR